MKKKIYSETEPVCEYPECTANYKFISKAQILNNDIENILQSPSIKTDNNLLKACHYCYTYYCSSMCRELHWPEHKRSKCYYGHLASQCKKSITKIARSKELRSELSQIANSSFSSTKHTGFIWVNFKTIEEADEFVESQIKPSNYQETLLPKYVCYNVNFKNSSPIISDLFNTDDITDELKEFDALFNGYNPQKDLILLVSIQIEPQVKI